MKAFYTLFIALVLISLMLITLTSCCIDHEYGIEDVYVPTCTQNGYSTVTCKKCGYSYQKELVPSLGHDLYISKQGVEATCTENGYSDELTCRVCNKIIQQGFEISAIGHKEKITKAKIDATCIASGVTEEQHCECCGTTIKLQTTIPAYGHADLNGTGLCDRCGIPFGDKVHYIATIEDLKGIKDDLSGVYQMTADIILCGTNWEPLGSESSPFTGYLFGNGFSIIGLSISNESTGGLFAYNSGTIENVVVQNLYISVSDMDSTVGGLTSHNNGTIKNCKIDGVNTITNSVYYSESTKWPKYDGGSVSYIAIIGGISGVNNGTITDCSTIGTFNCEYSNTAVFSLSLSPLFPLPGGDDLQATSTIYFGVIAGQNKNEISNCRVNTSNSHLININAEKVKKYGLAIADTHAYIGSISGYNSAKIKNCTAMLPIISKNVQESNIFSSNLFEQGTKCTLNMHEDTEHTGIVAKNEGTISNTTYNK